MLKKLTLIILASVFFTIASEPVHASLSYGLPKLTSMPRKPDVLKGAGGTFRLSPWRIIVAPGTFSYDVYFENGCWDKSFPMRIGRYWQLSDICEFRPRPHFKPNKAPAVPEKSWVISYHYTDAEIALFGGLSFPEESLKIVFSEDHGESWKMLRSSVVDTQNNTVAAITDKEGGYMVMAGFVDPSTFYNYKEVKGIYTERGHMDQSWILTLLEYLGVFIGRVF